MRPRLAMFNTLLDRDESIALVFVDGADAAVEFRVDAHRVGDLPLQVERMRVRLPDATADDLEIRYTFPGGPFELSHSDDHEAIRARMLMQAAVGHIAERGDGYLTVHLGLPDDADHDRFVRAADHLGELVQYGADHGVRVCLENLRWGMTSRLDAFLELVEATGAGVTFDVGHAVSAESAAGFSALRFANELGDRIENVRLYGRAEAGHLPPHSIAEIAPLVDCLLATQCSWWNVALFGLTEALTTRDMLLSYFDTLHLGLRAHAQPIQ